MLALEREPAQTHALHPREQCVLSKRTTGVRGLSAGLGRREMNLVDLVLDSELREQGRDRRCSVPFKGLCIREEAFRHLFYDGDDLGFYYQIK